MNRFLVTECVDPYENLAIEELLFDRQGDGATFYLWQNEHTVVIGRNQNAWRECRVELLESEGGKLARRSSGGGAVFHDLGNLNFTFLLLRERYDLPRQLSVIQKAVATFGIETSYTGRNDLVIQETGEKFSGNAFRFTNQTALHHGTILINADFSKLGRYLAPSQLKLESKGVKSVVSRVANLGQKNPELTVERMKLALRDAFEAEYGVAEHLDISSLRGRELDSIRERYASWDWRFGTTPAFNVSLEHRLPFGCFELLLNVKNGFIVSSVCYSDAMDETLPGRIESLLAGCEYGTAALCERLESSGGEEEEQIADYLKQQTL
ncbi:MAG: lipoate--protein ligase [Eubacteriales bacterium]|nr:lipoate--protein ligase [Eubacteriales bacterium]